MGAARRRFVESEIDPMAWIIAAAEAGAIALGLSRFPGTAAPPLRPKRRRAAALQIGFRFEPLNQETPN